MSFRKIADTYGLTGRFGKYAQLTVILVMFTTALSSSMCSPYILAERQMPALECGPPRLIITENHLTRLSTMANIPGSQVEVLKSMEWVEDVGVYEQLRLSVIVALDGFHYERQFVVKPSPDIPISSLPGWAFLPDPPYSKRVLFTDYGAGFIGVSPGFMTKQCDVEKIMVEGTFLTDNDTQGILVCRELAERIGLKAGDKLWLEEPGSSQLIESYCVRGFFNDSLVGDLRSLDGLPLNKPFTVDGFTSDKIDVIANYAARAPYILNGLVVLIRSGCEREALNFAREWAFVYGCNATIISENRVASYALLESVGGDWRWIFLTLLGSLIVINIINATVYELRKEIGIFSALGADPQCIRRLVTIMSIPSMAAGLLLSLVLIGIFVVFLSCSLTLKVDSFRAVLANLFPSISVVAASVRVLLQMQKTLAVTVPSRIVCLNFSVLFSGENLDRTSTIPRRFKPEHFPYVALFMEKFIREHETPLQVWKREMHLYDTRLQRKPGWVMYTSKAWIRRGENSASFQMSLELLAEANRAPHYSARLRLSPMTGRWGVSEKICAEDLVKTLRKEILNLNIEEAPEKSFY